jgi:para-nitrobenzyl esterase
MTAGLTQVILTTTSGPIIGTPTPDGTMQAFLGIPYADPPMRFERAKPVTPWTVPRPAFSYGPACIQTLGNTVSAFDLRPSATTSEDCLTLNVWRPAGRVNLPILFFIHGGRGKGSGSATAYSDFPSLAKNAVVVTVEYRLMGLGSLALPELSAMSPDGASGNQSFWDIRLALQWVHDNAVALGGNPDAITIHGESMGGFATQLLYLSPKTAGLFSSAIIQSWPYDGGQLLPLRAAPGLNSAEVQGLNFANDLHCTGPSVLRCLQELPLQTLTDAFNQVVTNENNPGGTINLSYNVDGISILRQPGESFAKGEFNRVPIVIGTMKWEPGPFTALTWFGAIYDIQTSAAAFGLSNAVAQQLVSYYVDSSRFATPSTAVSVFHHDIAYHCYARKLLDVISNSYGVPAAGYEMDYAPWFFLGGTATHGGELQLLFGSQNFTPYFTPTDAAVSRDLANRWTSFGDAAVRLQTWQLFGSGKVMNHLGPSPSISTNLRGEVCDVIDQAGIYTR